MHCNNSLNAQRVLDILILLL